MSDSGGSPPDLVPLVYRGPIGLEEQRVDLLTAVGGIGPVFPSQTVRRRSHALSR